MTLTPLPAFADNYVWMLHDGRQALVVDPGDAQPVFNALQAHDLRLGAILVTHHHPDHVGGVAALREATGAPVHGPAREHLPWPFQGLAGGDAVTALGLRWEVIDVPGHTAGHIAYYCDGCDCGSSGDIDGGDDGSAPLLFCGDTLFSAGCGWLFEGTPTQMLASLDRLAALPGRTRVCCAHEYTLANLRFARAVEPGNDELARHSARCEALRATRHPTLPSTIALERRINPFLRTREHGVAEAVRAFDAHAAQDEVGVFAALRQWKNQFR